MSRVLTNVITEAIGRAGEPARAEQEQRYLKSTRLFAGCDVPTCRRIARQHLAAHERAHGPLTHAELRATINELWDGPFFETRRAAVELLVRNTKLLGPADLTLLRDLIADGETWAIVDDLAVRVVGPIFDNYPAEAKATFEHWAINESFWVRRSVLLAHLPALREGAGDWPSFTHYAEQMLPETEFFIRKAIGWVLRETSKKRPELVREWVTPRLHDMSGTTRREATKYL